MSDTEEAGAPVLSAYHKCVIISLGKGPNHSPSKIDGPIHSIVLSSRFYGFYVNMFPDFSRVILAAIANVNPDLIANFIDPDNEEALTENELAHAHAMCALTKHFQPVVDVCKEEFDHLMTLARLMHRAASASRNDDTNKLRDAIIGYLLPRGQVSPFAESETYEPLVPDAAKETTRGFLNHDTAVLLCPMSMRERFQDNPEEFMALAHEGNIKLTSEDFPAFMWPYGTRFRNGFMSEGLCLGEILIDVVRLFLLGSKAVRNKTKIMKCRAKTYRITNITGEIIMYAAVHTLNTLLDTEEFTTVVRNLDFTEFYRIGVALFKNSDDRWTKDTLNEWDRRVPELAEFATKQLAKSHKLPKVIEPPKPLFDLAGKLAAEREKNGYTLTQDRLIQADRAEANYQGMVRARGVRKALRKAREVHNVLPPHEEPDLSGSEDEAVEADDFFPHEDEVGDNNHTHGQYTHDNDHNANPYDKTNSDHDDIYADDNTTLDKDVTPAYDWDNILDPQLLDTERAAAEASRKAEEEADAIQKRKDNERLVSREAKDKVVQARHHARTAAEKVTPVIPGDISSLHRVVLAAAISTVEDLTNQHEKLRATLRTLRDSVEYLKEGGNVSDSMIAPIIQKATMVHMSANALRQQCEAEEKRRAAIELDVNLTEYLKTHQRYEDERAAAARAASLTMSAEPGSSNLNQDMLPNSIISESMVLIALGSKSNEKKRKRGEKSNKENAHPQLDVPEAPTALALQVFGVDGEALTDPESEEPPAQVLSPVKKVKKTPAPKKNSVNASGARKSARIQGTASAT